MSSINNLPIGVIDSGIGGLSIWKVITEQLPNESIIYLADQAHIPYGVKSEQEIYKLSKKLISYLALQKVKLIVIACNTITVSCLEKLRLVLPQIPVVGTVPVIKTAALVSRNKQIGVLATPRTVNSSYQKELIEKFAGDCIVTSVGSAKLVEIVEKGRIMGEEARTILQEVLKPFQNAKVDTLALACTHFPFLKQEIQAILGKEVAILDSSDAVTRQVQRILTTNDTLSTINSADYRFLTTGNKEPFKKVAEILLRKPINQVSTVKYDN